MSYHYVYRITNLDLHKHYYGSRTSKCQPKDDLGIIYFSSSKNKDFIQDQKLYPTRYKYKIIKEFSCKDQALLFEIKMHNKFDVGRNENFYNRAKQTSTSFSFSNLGQKRPDHSTRMAGSNNPFFGKKHTEETLDKLRKVNRASAGRKVKESRKRIMEDGRTLQEHITEKRMKTMTDVVEGTSIYDNSGQKSGRTRKARGSQRGSKNGRAKIVQVQDANDTIIFTGYLETWCTENNYPLNVFRKSLRTGERVFSKERPSDISQYLRIYGKDCYNNFKGWKVIDVPKN